jgi:2-desacetyl-2-hydroxyethyl bacteriochlorophyllide A dehydrogenase
MRAAVLQAPRRLEIVERSTPQAGPGEAVVRMASTAVCHTDLAIYTGKHPGVRYPIVMGHESAGVVESIGEGVDGLKPGQHVIINPIIACGRCEECMRGASNLCNNAGLFGREVDGSLRQYVTLPSRYLHVLPPSLPFAQATIVETLATVRHAQQRAGLARGESVVVLGQGTTGLLHTRLAVLTGASPVIAVTRTRWKLDMAARMGAHHLVEASVEKAVDEVRRLTGGKGAHVVIETAGAAASFKSGVDMLRPSGRLCSFAVSQEPAAGFTSYPLYVKEASIIGTRALKPEDIAPCIELVASGAVDTSGFISTTYPLEQTAAAFDNYERNPGRILRIVIDSQA